MAIQIPIFFVPNCSEIRGYAGWDERMGDRTPTKETGFFAWFKGYNQVFSQKPGF